LFGDPTIWIVDGDLFGHFFTGTLEAAVVFARDWAERSARK
jgi:hypothetical protein